MLLVGYRLAATKQLHTYRSGSQLGTASKPGYPNLNAVIGRQPSTVCFNCSTTDTQTDERSVTLSFIMIGCLACAPAAHQGEG